MKLDSLNTLLTKATIKNKGGEMMCMECIPIDKNHEKQLHDFTELQKKEDDNEDHERI